MAEEDEDGITRVDFGKNRSTLTVKTGDKLCNHLRVVVAEFSRTVECAACEAVLDPMVVLLEYAKRERSFQAATSARDALARQVAQLRIEERRIKRRIAQAARKASLQQSLF